MNPPRPTQARRTLPKPKPTESAGPRSLSARTAQSLRRHRYSRIPIPTPVGKVFLPK